MSRELKWGAGVFVVALAVRLIVLVTLLPELKPDANPDYYRELGRNLAAGNGFVAVDRDGELRPNVGRTPGYPAFLAGLMLVGGDRLGLLLAANCVLAAVTCLLTVLLAARWLSATGAGVAGLITALDPNSIVRCLDVKAEMLFTLLLIGGLLLLVWRPRETWTWLACGLLWSLATLCRPIAMWLPATVVVALLAWRVRWVALAWFAIGFMPLIGAWMMRNALLTDRWMLSSAGPFNLIMSWSTGIEAKRTGRNPDEVQRELVARVGFIEFVSNRQRFDEIWRNHLTVARAIIGSAPLVAIREGLLGTAKALLGPGQRSLDYALQEPRPAARWWPPVYVAALAGLVALSLWGAFKLRREGVLLIALVTYFIALSCGPMTNSRFRYPVMPLLAVLAVAAIPVARGAKS